MDRTILGLHHITCITAKPQEHIDFYVKTLGLRLVKLTVNHDDPGTYHTYFGDYAGSPGTLMTFFPWPGAHPGRLGIGATSAIAFSIPLGSASFWRERLEAAGCLAIGSQSETRFGEAVVRLRDVDQLPIELIESLADTRPGQAAYGVPEEYAIRGFHSVTVLEAAYAPTAQLLGETMGMRLSGEEPLAPGDVARVSPLLTGAAGTRYRFAAGEGVAGTYTDLLVIESTFDGRAPRAQQGAGTVHHIAHRVPDAESHAAWHETVAALDYNVSPIIDRNYFKSIYFREPGGVLFEFATDPPGMTYDETLETLGQTLVLPPTYEPVRDRIEAVLPKLKLPTDEYAKSPSVTS